MKHIILYESWEYCFVVDLLWNLFTIVDLLVPSFYKYFFLNFADIALPVFNQLLL